MRAEYKRDLQSNYLILEIPEEAEESSYRMHMAEQNKIAGLLLFHSSRKDGVLQIHYEVTSMQPLDNLFEKRAMGYQDILSLLSGIRNTLAEMQKYLLNPAQIVFDPQYVFLKADRRSVSLCYIPATQNDAPITMLAEFILKKLNHEDRQAVAVGYGFYQKTLEENFSLQQALREILPAVREQEEDKNGKEDKEQENGSHGFGRARSKDDFSRRGEDFAGEKNGEISFSRKAEETFSGERNGGDEGGKRSVRRRYEENSVKEGFQNYQNREEDYEVIHKERKKEKLTDKLFSVVHPAVLLSSLFLTAALELIFYLGYLNLTEAGGVFFLFISAEAFINKQWRDKKEGKQQDEARWADEEDEEMYRLLREEMYDIAPKEEQIEETRCLVPEAEDGRLHLVCINPAGLQGNAPDITVSHEPVYIGKIAGESDVILNSPTISRTHARLSRRSNAYYVKDLNSKNGTFCNEKRLRPQEEQQLEKGDVVAFAEITYRVT